MIGPLPDGFTEKNNGECRNCRAPLRWARQDSTGKMVPFNLDGTRHRDDEAPPVSQPRSAGNPGAAAAVAVVEAARTFDKHLDDEPGCGGRCQYRDDLHAAVVAFDQAIGVMR